jgi:hypothetical protein
MTDVSTTFSGAAPFAEGEFRIGRVFSRATAVFLRNFPVYFVVTTVAHLPNVLLSQGGKQPGGAAVGWLLLGVFLTLTLGMLSQAIVVHGAFQDMRRKPVSLAEAIRVAFSRFLPILGLAICAAFAVGFGLLLLIVPGYILLVMWYVAAPACVVERLGPFDSLKRSAVLTKGHRWAIFGMIMVVGIPAAIVGAVIGAALGQTGNASLVMLGALIWGGVSGAFTAIVAVVAYHDLRVAKEGIDTQQIASVFD